MSKALPVRTGGWLGAKKSTVLNWKKGNSKTQLVGASLVLCKGMRIHTADWLNPKLISPRSASQV